MQNRGYRGQREFDCRQIEVDWAYVFHLIKYRGFRVVFVIAVGAEN